MPVAFQAMRSKRGLIGVLPLCFCLVASAGDGLMTQLWPPRRLTGAAAAGIRAWEGLKPAAIDWHPAGLLIGIDGARQRIFLDRGSNAPYALAERGLSFPTRIFARSGLQFYTLDPGARSIDVFDLQGRWETRFDLDAAALEVPLQSATDFCLDSAGDLYILDASAGCIHTFSPEGMWLRLLEAWGDWVMDAPLALEADGRGQLHLLESRPPTVLTLDADGRLLQRHVLRDETGQSYRPAALATDPWGNLFVGAPEGGRIQVLPADGAAPWWITGTPTMRIADLATDGEGRLFAADPRAACVWIFELTYAKTGRARER